MLLATMLLTLPEDCYQCILLEADNEALSWTNSLLAFGVHPHNPQSNPGQKVIKLHRRQFEVVMEQYRMVLMGFFC